MQRDLPDAVSHPFGDDAACWLAVATRDASADGRFFYGVATTGVYCRPSCGARLPRRENVRFHATAAEAEAAGFRPCRRCRPLDPPPATRLAARVADACGRLEAEEPVPALADLARDAGLGPHHFHRLFKAATGVTPRAYAQAHRAARVRDALQAAPSVTAALYDAGYASSARFYDDAPAMLGMAPRAWRQGGADAVIRFAVADCSLGALLVAATERGVCAVSLGDDPERLVQALQDRFPRAELIGGDAAFERRVAEITTAVEHPSRAVALDLPLDVRGTAFQQRVWQALRQIPPGQTRTYAAVAEQVGAPAAVRAVAAACAANTLAVLVPCHRVVRQDGALSGYRWGVARKRALLDREGDASCTPTAPHHAGGVRPLEAFDWPATEAALDARGHAVLPGLLDRAACAALAARYAEPTHFRSRVVMGRHGFGRGEYQYFAYPLPAPLAPLRAALYARLQPIANRWHATMGLPADFPPEHAAFLARCHAAGQTRPTPLLLQYGEGDFNCLHQDLYGDHVFPLQVAVLLSSPGEDFTGGEFVMTEQRPRQQTRASVVPLGRGDAVVMAVHHRPVQGVRGPHRVQMRHGVADVRGGRRHTLGLIFHDAA